MAGSVGPHRGAEPSNLGAACPVPGTKPGTEPGTKPGTERGTESGTEPGTVHQRLANPVTFAVNAGRLSVLDPGVYARRTRV